MLEVAGRAALSGHRLRLLASTLTHSPPRLLLLLLVLC